MKLLNLKKKSKSDIIFEAIIVVFLICLFIVTFYPFWYVFIVSVNDPIDSMRGGISLLPRSFTLSSYAAILKDNDFVRSIGVSVARVVIGTPLAVLFTAMLAFVLSKKELVGYKFWRKIFVFTMYFGGGTIPTYMVYRTLGLIDSFWVYIIPSLVGVYNMILINSFINGLPKELEESAKIDGANDWIILIRIILPMCMASLMTITLLYFVAKWNDWFNALIYLNDRSMYPVQLILREILVNNEDKMLNQALLRDSKNSVSSLGFKCAIIVIAMAPLIIIYPFVQRFFVKGILIGAVKG